jgi:hypothetical protein
VFHFEQPDSRHSDNLSPAGWFISLSRSAHSGLCTLRAEPPSGGCNHVEKKEAANRGLWVRRIEGSAIGAVNCQVMDLPVVGMHQNGPANSAEIIDGVIAGYEDRRRVYCASIRRLPNNFEHHTLACGHWPIVSACGAVGRVV